MERDLSVAVAEIALLGEVEQDRRRREPIGIGCVAAHVELAALRVEQQQYELFGDQHGFPPLQPSLRDDAQPVASGVGVGCDYPRGVMD